MIKKYNQFVKGKVNEEFEMADPGTKPVTAPPVTTPDTRPSRPGVVPTTIPSEEDAPLARYEEEEEGGEYIGKKMMNDLASELGTEIEEDGSINYNGKKINFYSETEKFHVDRKKFDTVEQVVDYLQGGSTERVAPKLEEEDRIDPEFEAKSYKFSRRERRLK